MHIAVEMVGHTLVVVHDATHPDDKNWEIYLEALRQNSALLEAQLVVTDGGSPDSAQRRASLKLVPAGRPAPPTAVVTSSVLVRGVVAALSWFMKDKIRAFSPAEFDEACAFIGAAAEKAILGDVAARLRQTLH